MPTAPDSAEIIRDATAIPDMAMHINNDEMWIMGLICSFILTHRGVRWLLADQ
jgi:hypothetical protein